MVQIRWLVARRFTASVVFCLAANVDAYDYERIVEEYCHTAKDWGAIPQRPKEAERLLQVQVFIRHGARVQCTADACWPGDAEGNFTCGLNYLESSVDSDGPPLTQDFRTEYLPGRNALPGNCMTGQLVPDGLQMQVANGERLREAYVLRERLLPESLRGMEQGDLKRAFFLRSTDVPRTRQSGMALFSGLYRDHRGSRPPYLQLHTMDTSEENMWINTKVCPTAQLATDEFFRTYSGAEALEGMCRELGQDVDGSPASRHRCMSFLGRRVDCLMSRMCPTVPFHPRNSTIPPAYLSDAAALLRRLWRTVDRAQFEYFRALRRPGIGPFVSEVLAAASAAAEGRREATPFVLWSGHDTGPMEPLWAAFDLREGPPFWPPFASMLVLELWNSSSGPLARWVSNGAVVGGGPWAWPELRRRSLALVPSAEECRAPSPKAGIGRDEEQPRPRVLGPQMSLSTVAPALAGASLALLSVAACHRSQQGKERSDSETLLLTDSPPGARVPCGGPALGP